MFWVLFIGGVVVSLFGLFVLWGIVLLRRSQDKAFEEIQNIELADIEPLARECIEVFQRELGIHLNMDNCEDAARKLDDAFHDSTRLKAAFERDDYYWRFVEPMGACLGELLRLHAKHEWRKEADEAPYMEVVLRDGSSQTYPFEKVIKQAQGGAPGDIVAYVAFARTIEHAGVRKGQEP